GVYREVVEPERIVYIGEPGGSQGCGGGLPPRALVTITFAGHDGKTTLTIDTRFEAVADRDAAVEMEFNTGWASSLDRLADLLKTL
ncbi:MAG: SRPBCC domain-containing protein, partial [Methylocella sp.]